MSERSFYKSLEIGYNRPTPFRRGSIFYERKRSDMRKRLLAALAALALMTSCAPKSAPKQDDALHILATTYPVYLFTTAVTGELEGIEVELLVNAQTACLHDYTLTVEDMKAIEGADVIVMNGVGLEDFMSDALAASDAAVIDCSEGIKLLPTLEHAGHDGHDHEEEYDPHIWMNPNNVIQMVDSIAQNLCRLDEAHRDRYEENREAATERLTALDESLTGHLVTGILYASDGTMAAPAIPCWRELITFHDGFQYFAGAYDFTLLKAIEEEEGSTASAAEIKEIVGLIEAYRIPAIFVEKNGSRATAEVIARETGCEIYELDMLMSGEGSGLQSYLDVMRKNMNTIVEALA